ncbi:MAG TPA: hypothetical protein PLU83_13940 [Phycicoccus sp.]|nr:hypothetical protein [Phycicoccus sp.]HRA46307.1 hypothetical protein [Phycicoccus sp.]
MVQAQQVPELMLEDGREIEATRGHIPPVARGIEIEPDRRTVGIAHEGAGKIGHPDHHASHGCRVHGMGRPEGPDRREQGGRGGRRHLGAAARAEGSSQQRALVIEDGDRGGAPPQVHPDRVVEGHGEGP